MSTTGVRDVNEPLQLERTQNDATTETSFATKLVQQKAIYSGEHDSYQIQQKLGSGGFGKVFLVQPLKNPKMKYAMKLVTDIKMEAKILEKATHSHSIHLCKILDQGFSKEIKSYFMVVDLLGLDLYKYYTRTNRRIRYKFAEQCLIAIESFHNLGFLHRDVKPDNFVLGQKGTEMEYVVFLIDFGLCRSVKEKPTTFAGTRAYASIATLEGKQQGPKDDLESWFYMALEWVHGNLPWRTNTGRSNPLALKKEIRDDKSLHFNTLFGWLDAKKPYYDQNFYEFGKIMRSIDCLTADEKPDYDKIHYFLQRGYEYECMAAEIEHKQKLKELRKNKEALATYIADFEQKQEMLLKILKNTRGTVAQPQNLVFFSSIDYASKRKAADPNGKYVQNLEFNLHQLSLKNVSKSNSLSFFCQSCVGSDQCSLNVHVFYDGTQRTWDEAKVIKVTGFPEKCKRLVYYSEKYPSLPGAEELKNSFYLDSWKIVSNSHFKGCFKVSSMKFMDTKEYVLKAVKLTEDQTKFESELKILLLQKISKLDHLVQYIDNGKGNGYSFFVISNLGPTLEQLRLQSPDKTFSLGTTYSIALQCIDALQQLHTLGFIHSQISPDVFSIDSINPRQILLFNLETSIPIVEQKREKYNDCLFKPNSRCFSPSPKPEEDIESLLYSMILCLNGSVPWQDVNDNKVVTGLRLNMLITGDQIPKEIRDLLRTVPYAPSLDYATIKQEMLDGLKERQLSIEDPYDWEKPNLN